MTEEQLKQANDIMSNLQQIKRNIDRIDKIYRIYGLLDLPVSVDENDFAGSTKIELKKCLNESMIVNETLAKIYKDQFDAL